MTSAAHPPDAAPAWKRVAAMIDARDADAVAAAVVDLDEDGRRAVAAALPGHLKAARAAREPWEGIGDVLWAFRAAGAGTLGGAAAVASWLNRREFNNRWLGDPDDDGRLLDIWAGRDDAWRADLARRLAVRLRGPRYVGLSLVLTLLAETGAEPPDHDPLVVGWTLSGPPRPKDPLLPALLPRVFEAEGVGRALRRSNSWPVTLATMAARGDADPAALIDGCVRRFLRGGTELDLRFFVRLHDLLMDDDPSVRRDETAARARDYVRLLPSAPGPVAGHVLDLLREVPDLPAALLAEALDGVLFRPEAGIVRKGLSWLRTTVQRRPDMADACARALARAFGHESYAVRERAVRLALALPDRTDGTPLAAAAPLLPPDLGTRLASRYGGEVAPPVADDPDPAPAPLAPAAPRPAEHAPPPITTPAELARAFADLDRSLAGMEGLMAAFVALARTEPDAVRAALRPVLAPDFYPYIERERTWARLPEWLVAAGRSFAGSAPVPDDWRDRMPGVHDVCPVDLLALHRAAELLGAVEAGSLPPVLLATPTAPAGHIDAAVLTARLRTFAETGATPAPADLQQALLRLRHGPHPEGAECAARLGTPAARTVARWLEDPPVARIAMEDGRRGRPRATIGLEGVAGPLVDPGFATTFPNAAAPVRSRSSAESDGPFVLTAFPADADPDAGSLRRLEQNARDVATRSGGPAHDRWVEQRAGVEGRTPGACVPAAEPVTATETDVVPPPGPERDAAGESSAESGAAPITGMESRAYVSNGPTAAWARPEPRRDGFGAIATAQVGPSGTSAGPRTDGPTGLPLIDAIMAPSPAYRMGYRRYTDKWRYWLPSHREVAAAYLDHELRDDHPLSTEPGSPSAALLALTPANGPLAEGFADYLARCLGHSSSDRADRRFLDVCRRGELPADALARRTDRLLRAGELRPSRVARGLGLAAEAGAFADVWQVLTIALPLLGPGPGRRPVQRFDRFLELGTRTARWCGARGAIPEIDALAARKGTAAYLRAARALAAQLAP
ncbi:DUF6493 family protein [Actinomadura sp. WMMB 499]|uniref:DUF6493 family protein n=1 Tax=Actinomadura sp. WMMB 499 TaxID=1219491 RepID=UPI0020C78FD3|nr:DUF6493 family protein [Actinomadura sp. WMMB 499]